ncbi:MAG: hypothetical protein CM1200mP1_04880 [Candidatus Neomarinimicrobiota bacterium]|nr:MAG: hypothetical protein CM1200mP1_04880 [Candidatus Neomarinimicrobiota bacterium]
MKAKFNPADEHNHIWKHDFKVPFVCGCRNLGEAFKTVGEGGCNDKD